MISSQFSINCPEKMMEKIEAHCFSETQVEVGGFLVGYLEGNTAHVTNVFPAKHSVGASTQLTFTHDSWNAIYQQLEKEPEGTSLIGWFHSHPNFGVFLSDHDKFIQSNFFKQDGQITIVVDPIRGRKGWFFSNAGKIEVYKEETATNRKRLGVSDSNADQNIEAMLGGSKKGVSLPKVIAISAIMSLISFVAGWTLTTSASTDRASQETVTQLLNEVEQIKMVLIENGIGVAQVPTKPKVVATPKATVAPKVVATPKSSVTPKGTSTVKPATAAKKGAKCNAGDKDATGKLLCQKNAANKFVWVAPLPSRNSASPSQSSAVIAPKPDSPTAGS